LGTCRSSRRKRRRDFLELVVTAGKQGCHGVTLIEVEIRGKESEGISLRLQCLHASTVD
jgi:hypothetical protein